MHFIHPASPCSTLAIAGIRYDTQVERNEDQRRQIVTLISGVVARKPIVHSVAAHSVQALYRCTGTYCTGTFRYGDPAVRARTIRLLTLHIEIDQGCSSELTAVQSMPLKQSLRSAPGLAGRADRFGHHGAHTNKDRRSGTRAPRSRLRASHPGSGPSGGYPCAVRLRPAAFAR
jgi:hypothetical protein